MNPRPAAEDRRAPSAPANPARLRKAGRWLAFGTAFGTAIGIVLGVALAAALPGGRPRAHAAAPAPALTPTPAAARTLKVPWSRPSSKHSVLAALNGGRIQVFDLEPLYDELVKRPAPRRPQRIDLRLPEVWLRFYPITNEAYCMQFRPREGAGESWAEARLPGSAWRRARDRFTAERYTYFFWVAGDSFETFRALREILRGEGVEVAWKPVRPDAPLEICRGLGSGLEPQ